MYFKFVYWGMRGDERGGSGVWREREEGLRNCWPLLAGEVVIYGKHRQSRGKSVNVFSHYGMCEVDWMG